MVRIWAIVTTIAAFGPYVIGHIDTGQLAASASALFILVFGVPQLLGSRHARPGLVVVPWVWLYAVIIVATIWTPYLGGYTQFPLINEFGTYALPLELILVVWYWTLIVPVSELLDIIARSIVIAMTCNALISIYQLVTSNVTILSVVQKYWSIPDASTSASGTVGALASENGRYVGIFYQPAIAGVAYGIALFCLIFLVQTHPGRRQIWLMLSACALCAGGIVSVSKVFLIGALPLALVLIVQDRSRKRLLGVLAAFTGVLIILGINNVLPAWGNGSVMLQHLLKPSGSLIATYTAGRFGSTATSTVLNESWLSLSPWDGFGAGGIATQYDSMWTETLAVSGLIGTAFLAVEFIALFGRWLGSRDAWPQPQWRLTGATLVLALAGSFGVPTLTGQRISTMLWLILGFLIVPGTLSALNYGADHLDPGLRGLEFGVRPAGNLRSTPYRGPGGQTGVTSSDDAGRASWAADTAHAGPGWPASRGHRGRDDFPPELPAPDPRRLCGG